MIRTNKNHNFRTSSNEPKSSRLYLNSLRPKEIHQSKNQKLPSSRKHSAISLSVSSMNFVPTLEQDKFVYTSVPPLLLNSTSNVQKLSTNKVNIIRNKKHKLKRMENSYEYFQDLSLNQDENQNVYIPFVSSPDILLNSNQSKKSDRFINQKENDFKTKIYKNSPLKENSPSDYEIDEQNLNELSHVSSFSKLCPHSSFNYRKAKIRLSSTRPRTSSPVDNQTKISFTDLLRNLYQPPSKPKSSFQNKKSFKKSDNSEKTIYFEPMRYYLKTVSSN